LSWSVETSSSTPSAANAASRPSSGADASKLRPEWTWKSEASAFFVLITRFRRNFTIASWPAPTVTRWLATPYSMPRVA
jgi:hypothetical protein